MKTAAKRTSVRRAPVATTRRTSARKPKLSLITGSAAMRLAPTDLPKVAAAVEDRVNGQTLAEAFPNVNPGVAPAGSRILVQIRMPIRKTAGGIFVPDSSVDTEGWTCTTAKVIALGPAAFKNREKNEAWWEGPWCQPGDFIVTPRYGGQRWGMPHAGASVTFLMFEDHDILGKITVDPRLFKAFI